MLHRTEIRIVATLAVLVAVVPCVALAQSRFDGSRYDQGRLMSERSPRADAQLDKMHDYIGQWDVLVTSNPDDSTAKTSAGTADVTFMNRGYAYQERLHIEPSSPTDEAIDQIGFLVFQASSKQWVLGEVSGFTEHVEVYNGGYDGDVLRLSTAVRRVGGVLLTHYEVTYTFESENAFVVELRVSTDGGLTWATAQRRVYRRRDASDDFMATRADAGEPDPNRPAEASQFDFLIGEWTAQQELNFGGNPIRFPSNATAVFALGGKAIMEHSWHNLDVNLPDAATTIVRIYNRAERRWESLYLSNRGNGMLDFGGNWEGDRMVLHNFETNLGDTISRYVFHSIAKDSYKWYAESSTDRAKTFKTTWKIDMARNK